MSHKQFAILDSAFSSKSQDSGLICRNQIKSKVMQEGINFQQTPTMKIASIFGQTKFVPEHVTDELFLSSN